MGAISRRQSGYVGGLGAFFLGTVAYVIGFSTNYWCQFTFNAGGLITIDVHAGLWQGCFTFAGTSSCSTSSSEDGWMIAVKVLQCLALAGLGLASLYAFVVNFIVDNPQFNRFLEICTSSAGSLGVAGAAVYAAKGKHAVDDYNDNYGSTISSSFDDFTFHWSFGVNIGGAALVLLASCLIGINNKPLAPNTTTNATTAGHAVAFSNMAPPNTGTGAPQVTIHTAHAPYPGSYPAYQGGNPYAVSVVQQPGGFSPPPPYYQHAGVPANGLLYAQTQAPPKV